MAFGRHDELPLGDRVLGIELAARGGEVTLTLTRRAAGGAGPRERDRLRLRLEDVPSLRIALDRAVALAGAAAGAAVAPGGEGLVRRFHGGESIARIAARYGCTPDAVRARLRVLGHDPRLPEHCPSPGCAAGRAAGLP
ncbi:hypothetical protein ACFQMG_36240, partial [Kitasatospora paranensis]